MTQYNGMSRWVGLLVATIGVSVQGCAFASRRAVEPHRISNPRLGPMTIAVAPAINLSGSTDFDPNRFADLMAVELTFVDGVTVIPVSRVLAAMAAEGSTQVTSPRNALDMAKLVGADSILVFAVTEYDPYDPPSIGISAQLYGSRRGAGDRSMDPVALSRQAAFRGPDSGRTVPDGLLAQNQRTHDASHASLSRDLKRFARWRNAEESPYGWRKYVVSQQHFIQYCCYATLQALFDPSDESDLAAVDRRVRKP